MSSLNPSDTSIAKSVLTEPIPAPAEKTTVRKETDDTSNEMEEDLIDYNEVDAVVNHSRETKRKILRDALAENGFALRNVLLSEPIINHYASPLAMEEMSVEDIMSEIPTRPTTCRRHPRPDYSAGELCSEVHISHCQSAKSTQTSCR